MHFIYIAADERTNQIEKKTTTKTELAMNWTRVLLVALAALGLVVEEVASLSLDPGRCRCASCFVFTVVFTYVMCKHAIAAG